MRLVVVLAIVVLAVILAAQNARVVSLSLFIWTLEASLAVIIALCCASGALIAALAMAPGMFRRRADQRKLHKRIADLEAHTIQDKPHDKSRTDANALPPSSRTSPPHSTV